MRLAGLLLLASGWGVVFAALALLHSVPIEMAFVLAGIAVEILGFVFLARTHLPPRSRNREA